MVVSPFINPTLQRKAATRNQTAKTRRTQRRPRRHNSRNRDKNAKKLLIFGSCAELGVTKFYGNLLKKET
jgi:hypothetical protein